MLAALHLILVNDDILHSVVLSPLVTDVLLIGAGAGFLRLVVDVVSLLAWAEGRGARD